MTRRGLPSIAPTDLRDHANPERIDRIWRRIERDLPLPEPVSRVGRPRFVWSFAAAAAAAAFASGLLIGRVTAKQHAARAPEAVASPERVINEVLAAGTRSLTLPLWGGGGSITLAPGTTVEREREDGSSTTLRLVQGEASVDVASAPKNRALAIVAGEATLSTRAGSVVHIRRGSDHMDVDVASGSASISSPNGVQQLRSGERVEAVPLHAPVTALQPMPIAMHGPHGPVASASADALPLEPPPLAVAAPVDPNAPPNPSKWKAAFEQLRQQPGGIPAAIKAASSAQELVNIGDVARGGGDSEAAIAAYTATLDRFPKESQADTAAYTLGTIYEKRGQMDLAQKYLAAVHGAFAELALYERFLIAEKLGHKTEAVALANEYVNKYPNGGYKGEADRVRGGDDGDRANAKPSGDAAP